MLGGRLKEVREYFSLSQKELAEKYDMATGTISQYEQNKRDIPIELILKLEHDYKINLHWFFTGVGEMFWDNELNNKGKDLVRIPIISNRASAGYGNGNYEIDSSGFFEVTSRVFKSLSGYNIKNIQVSGDSMSPTIEDGDWVTIAEGHVSGNGIYLLNCGGELFVKRLNFLLSGQIEIISDNMRYKTEFLQHENTFIIGKCVMRMGKV